MNAAAPIGAYGIRLLGLEDASELLVPAETGAPAFSIASEVADVAPADEFVDGERARLRLRSGGAIVIERAAGTALFRVPHPVRADELVHPYLAPAAAVIGRWSGRESFHAGAIAVAGRAWGVVGEREAGKSSTLAWLARAGAEIVCDDMLILDERRALTGPRSIDLREDAAARLGAGEPIGMTGARERWRLRLGPVSGAPVLAGWVFLAWGDEVELRRLPGRERLERLAAQRGLRLPPVTPEGLLELITLPAWELCRPRGWDSLRHAADRLLDLAGG